MSRTRSLLCGLVLIFAACPAKADQFDQLSSRISRDVATGAYEDGLAAAQALEKLVRARWGTSSMNYAAVMHNQALFLHNLGRYQDAIQKLQIAYDIKSHNPDFASFIRTSDLLSSTYEFIGQLEQARTVSATALQIGERSFGPNDIRLAGPLLGLGTIEQDLEHYPQAESYILKAVALFDQTPNADINDRADAYASLGDLYQRDSRFAEAEKQLLKAQSFLTNAFGAQAPMSPIFPKMLDDLANLYKEEGRYKDAEVQFKRLIDIENANPPTARPNLASDLGNLGQVYHDESRYAEAEDLFKQSIALYERTYGPQHPTLAIALESLANTYVSESRPNEAAPLLERVLAIREKANGNDSPDVARTLTNLANTYSLIPARAAEAGPLYQRALSIFESKFGADSKQSTIVLSSLAQYEEDQKDFDNAEKHFQAALRIDEKVLGQDHPSVLSDLNNLAHLEIGKGDYGAARTYLDRVLALADVKLGRSHGTTLAIRVNLADIEFRNGDWNEALRWLRMAKADSAKTTKSVRTLDIDAFLVRTLRHVADAASSDALTDEAFQVAQSAHETSAGSAVAQMAARFAAGSDAMALTIRHKQDLQNQLDALESLITAEIGKPDDKRNDATLARLRSDETKLQDQLDKAKQNLRRNSLLTLNFHLLRLCRLRRPSPPPTR